MNEYERFITQTGSGYENSKQRLFSIVTSNLPRNEKVTAVKNEYGTGGITYSDSSIRYDSHGMEVKLNDKKISFTWAQVLAFYETYFTDWLTPRYDRWDFDDYIENGIIPIEPMTAKEEDREEELEKMLTTQDYYVEEKLDGTRATLHVYGDEIRVFSRRISKKTGWYVENTDSLPHLREAGNPELHKTILDGEMSIPNRPFKDVASTLNCVPEKAIHRQIELGFIQFNAFDIVYYKGVYVAKMPLWKRKQYMQKAIVELRYCYIRPLRYSDSEFKLIIPKGYSVEKETYPTLHAELELRTASTVVSLSKRAYYEYIVAQGGEGVILKHKEGKYFHKRGREYTKLKKFMTKDCIIMGFNEPTKEYNGKLPDTWQYWEDEKPVSKFYAKQWVGNVRFGVIVTPKEIQEWEKINKTKAVVENINGMVVLEVGECSGFDEEQRETFSENPEDFVGRTVEILANEMFEKTGKLRHPRFLRLRSDKNPESCTWENHVRP